MYKNIGATPIQMPNIKSMTLDKADVAGVAIDCWWWARVRTVDGVPVDELFKVVDLEGNETMKLPRLSLSDVSSRWWRCIGSIRFTAIINRLFSCIPFFLRAIWASEGFCKVKEHVKTHSERVQASPEKVGDKHIKIILE